ncbi:MAG: DUF502 domain-containing protein [Rhodospirillales bacterium]|jgi:uncharacterized membrane protein
MERIRRNVLAGVVVVVPIWITPWVMSIVIGLIVSAGWPFALALARAVRPSSDEAADLLAAPWFKSGGAFLAVLGRRLIALFGRIMDRVPLARTIYGATRSLLEGMQDGSRQGQRVVLIAFPTPEMRAVGFVTRTFVAADTGEEVAAVYVPTTPNPTSGYVEIVPTARLVWLDWSADEAIAFIVSGGAMAPGLIRMRPRGPERSAAVSVDAAGLPEKDDRRQASSMPDGTHFSPTSRSSGDGS